MTLHHALTVYGATPDDVTWAKGHSRSITSTRRFVEHVAVPFVEEYGWVSIAGQRLVEDDVSSLKASMDKEAIKADELATDRIAERVMDHSQEADR